MKGIRQSGQAIVEAAAILGIVVMLFLGVYYLGKFHDIQAGVIQSARYAAWERTVHSQNAMSDVQVQNQARARLFAWNRDAFKTTDGLANGTSWKVHSSVWYDHAGRQRLIARPDDVVIGTMANPLPGMAAGTIARAFQGLTGAGARITGGESLPHDGLVTGTVAVKLANIGELPAPLDKLDLLLRENSAVVVDSWDASGPHQAALRSRSFTLAGPLTEIDGLLNPVKWVLGSIEPAFNNLHFGQICPDIVPVDRVQGASVLPAYDGGGACVR